MSGRRQAAIALAAAGIVTVAVVLAPEGRPAAGGAVARAAAPKPLGRTDPRSMIDFSLVLRTKERALRRFVHDVQDRASPRFRRFLGAKAFGERFGLDDRTLARTRRVLRSRGLHVTRAWPQRTALQVRGRTEQVERVFGVGLHDFRDAQGRRFHRPRGVPSVPAALRSAVTAVAGLDSRPVARADAVPEGGLMPADLARAYNITPLHEMGIRGQGQTVAIMSFDSFDEADVAEFDRLTGTEGPPVEKVPVGGGVQIGEGAVEVNLDIDTIRSIAPQAQILDFESELSSATGFGTVMDAIVADGRADIVSLSWSFCDAPDFLSAADRQRVSQSLRAAVAQGVSLFTSTGDQGAYTCQKKGPGDHRVSVAFPGDTPYTTAVGGTLLFVREDGTYLKEHGWEDVLAQAGGGGGLNPIDPRPEWQAGPGVDNEVSDGKRQVPDVAALADHDGGTMFVYQGEPQVGNGTSLAAPFWAGSMVLVRQFVARESGREGLGFVSPALYAIAANPPDDAPPFHDVVKGGNRLYNAGPGWDYSTGLGSPDVFNLAKAMNAYLGGG